MAFNQPKQHGGQYYTGMQVGGEHKWNYSETTWTEAAGDGAGLGSRFQFDSVKTRQRAAPAGSGAAVGTTYHWFFMANMQLHHKRPPLQGFERNERKTKQNNSRGSMSMDACASPEEECEDVWVSLRGHKYKVGHKRPAWKKWSYDYPNNMSAHQSRVAILEEELRALPSVPVPVKVEPDSMPHAHPSVPDMSGQVKTGAQQVKVEEAEHSSSSSSSCSSSSSNSVAPLSLPPVQVKIEPVDSTHTQDQAMHTQEQVKKELDEDEDMKQEQETEGSGSSSNSAKDAVGSSSKEADTHLACELLRQLLGQAAGAHTAAWSCTEIQWKETKNTPLMWLIDVRMKWSLPKRLLQQGADAKALDGQRYLLVSEQLATKLDANRYQTKMHGERYWLPNPDPLQLQAQQRSVLQVLLDRVKENTQPEKGRYQVEPALSYLAQQMVKQSSIDKFMQNTPTPTVAKSTPLPATQTPTSLSSPDVDLSDTAMMENSDKSQDEQGGHSDAEHKHSSSSSSSSSSNNNNNNNNNKRGRKKQPQPPTQSNTLTQYFTPLPTPPSLKKRRTASSACGVNKEEEDNTPESPLRHAIADAARSYRWDKLLELLHATPHLVNCTRPSSHSRYTPLHQAAHGNAPARVVDQLLNMGASTSALSSADETPADVARTQGHMALLPHLMQHSDSSSQ